MPSSATEPWFGCGYSIPVMKAAPLNGLGAKVSSLWLAMTASAADSGIEHRTAHRGKAATEMEEREQKEEEAVEHTEGSMDDVADMLLLLLLLLLHRGRPVSSRLGKPAGPMSCRLQAEMVQQVIVAPVMNSTTGRSGGSKNGLRSGGRR